MTTTEQERARMRAYYRANKEKILAYNRAYRKAHPEKWARKAPMTIEEKLKRSERNRRYYIKNREKILAYQKAWIAARPGYRKLHKSKAQ